MTPDEFAPLLGPLLAKALAERGYTELTRVQEAVLDPALADRDLRITSQTGSGKTLAIGFAVRALVAEPARAEKGVARPRALVVTPTRELARQVDEELAWLFARLRRAGRLGGGRGRLPRRGARARARAGDRRRDAGPAPRPPAERRDRPERPRRGRDRRGRPHARAGLQGRARRDSRAGAGRPPDRARLRDLPARRARARRPRAARSRARRGDAPRQGQPRHRPRAPRRREPAEGRRDREPAARDAGRRRRSSSRTRGAASARSPRSSRRPGSR